MNKKIRKIFSHTVSLLINIPTREVVSMEILSMLTGTHIGKLEKLFPTKNELLDDLFKNHIAKKYESLLNNFSIKFAQNPIEGIQKLINFYFELFDEKRLLRQTLLKNLTDKSEQLIKNYEAQIIQAIEPNCPGNNKSVKAMIMMDSMMGSISAFAGDGNPSNKKIFKEELSQLLFKMLN